MTDDTRENHAIGYIESFAVEDIERQAAWFVFVVNDQQKLLSAGGSQLIPRLPGFSVLQQRGQRPEGGGVVQGAAGH